MSSASEPLLNGDFVVIAIGVSSSGENYCWCLLTTKPSEAATGSCACAPIIYRFDKVLTAAPANTLVHIGAGTFETRGVGNLHTFSTIGYIVKSGQKIRGSGIAMTILKVIHAIDSLAQITAVSSYSLVPHFEASDFTVDCNLGGQPVPGGVGLAPVTCGALDVHGDHIRLRRIRAINWGCQCVVECFVLVASGTNSVIDDCVVERPSENNTHESTLMGAFGRGAVVRNNFVNCAYANGDYPVRVSSISHFSEKVALLTAVEPHRHTKSKNIVVSGATLDNAYKGVFAILEIVSDTQLKYQMHVDEPANADVSGGVMIGLKTSSEYVAVGAIIPSPLGTTNHYQVITKRPHHLTAGQCVALSGLDPGGTPFTTSHATYHRILSVEYNDGSGLGLDWVVLGNDFQPNAFTIRVAASLVSFSLGSALIGIDTHGPAAVGGTGCVTEGNRIHDCQNTYYTDTGSTMDTVVRNNFWTNVLHGIYHNLAGYDPFSAGVGSVAHVGLVATFNCTAPHGLLPGHAVDVRGVLVDGSVLNPFNGTFTVKTVSSISSFAYNMAEAPVGTIAGTPQFERRSQTRRFSIERNRIELRSSDANSALSPAGIALFGYGYDFVLTHPAYIFPQVLIRENILGYFGNGADTKPVQLGVGNTTGVQLWRADGVLIQENIFDVTHQSQGSDWRINELESNDVRCFHNRDSAGAPVRDYNRDAGRHEDSLEEVVQCALLAAI